MPTSKTDIECLLALRHHDPHQLLGVHAGGSGWVLRAYKPGAKHVWLRRVGQPDLELKQASGFADFFEVEFSDKEYPRGYRIKVSYSGGMEVEQLDPYAFPPTLGDLDLHLFGEGRHWRLWEKMGAHRMTVDGVEGVSFSVWAPGAASLSVVGDFNSWDGRLHPMRSLGVSGVWEIFIPELKGEFLYKFEIRPKKGAYLLKTDPLGRASEVPPGTASRYSDSLYQFKDEAWMQARAASADEVLRRPMTVYELHLGSWRRVPEEGGRSLTYKELAKVLPAYIADMGFTHIELMPIMEHPFGPSWGYQVGSYFAPTARFGSPDDFRELVDALHKAGIGIVLDWVPAHFPKDAHTLGRFTGEALYEHLDPRQGEHPDWGTFIFNFGRNEVSNFLVANALYWLKEFHLDGLRIDAVASMLYLDYSRKEGQWIPNRDGGRENIEAIAFLKQLNVEVYSQNPGAMVVAEESTAWTGVSRPTYAGGLGFGFKWNMGWMHDVLEYFSKDPVHRKFHHDRLTFGLLYAWTENFILPLSHDEVVHGKGSLIDKMPGDRWQKFANLRSLYGFMWAHPGKKLLFMGGEIGQWSEWRHDVSLDWHLLQESDHEGLRLFVRDLNRIYREEAALWDNDIEPAGFQWLEANAAEDNVLTFFRQARSEAVAKVVCVCNFSPVPREGIRVGVPGPGRWTELLNSDAAYYGGSNMGNAGGVQAEAKPWNNQPYSVALTLPPLSVLWLKESK